MVLSGDGIKTKTRWKTQPCDFCGEIFLMSVRLIRTENLSDQQSLIVPVPVHDSAVLSHAHILNTSWKKDRVGLC